MSAICKKIKVVFFDKSFIGFCVIGVINTFNTAFFSWLAHLELQENAAAHIGYFISLTVNYILNSIFIFKSRLGLKKYIRFLISYIPNFIIYTSVSLLTINVLEMNQFWATVLTTVAGGPVTFAIIKFYAFGGTRSNSDKPE